MTIITLDIETTPASNPAIRDAIRASIKPPATHKKQETIDAWIAENADSEAEKEWRKTSFDGSCGHICAIGVGIDDETPTVFFDPDFVNREAQILQCLFDLVDRVCAEQPNVRPVFVGHNLIDFDLRFIFQRSVILGVRPSRHIPFYAKPWDDAVFDTMARWDAKNRASMDKLCKAMGFDGKGDMDGSKVWDYVRDGRIAEVADYCKGDIERTRRMYKRMTFADLPMVALAA